MALLSLSSKLVLQNPCFPSLKLPHCYCHKSPSSPSLHSSSFAASNNSLHLGSSFTSGFNGNGLVPEPDSTAMAMVGTEDSNERNVFLCGEITDLVANDVITQLIMLEKKDPKKDIKLFINSPGGSLSATMAIYDFMRGVQPDISTVAFGTAASFASIILGGGTKGKRFAMPNARIMLNQPQGSASGQATDSEIQTRELMHSKDNVIRILSELTGHPFDQVEKDIDREHYMSPSEAAEYGLLDGIIDRDTVILFTPVPHRVKYEIH